MSRYCEKHEVSYTVECYYCDQRKREQVNNDAYREFLKVSREANVVIDAYTKLMKASQNSDPAEVGTDVMNLLVDLYRKGVSDGASR